MGSVEVQFDIKYYFNGILSEVDSGRCEVNTKQSSDKFDIYVNGVRKLFDKIKTDTGYKFVVTNVKVGDIIEAVYNGTDIEGVDFGSSTDSDLEVLSRYLCFMRTRIEKRDNSPSLNAITDLSKGYFDLNLKSSDKTVLRYLFGSSLDLSDYLPDLPNDILGQMAQTNFENDPAIAGRKGQFFCASSLLFKAIYPDELETDDFETDPFVLTNTIYKEENSMGGLHLKASQKTYTLPNKMRLEEGHNLITCVPSDELTKKDNFNENNLTQEVFDNSFQCLDLDRSGLTFKKREGKFLVANYDLLGDDFPLYPLTSPVKRIMNEDKISFDASEGLLFKDKRYPAKLSYFYTDKTSELEQIKTKDSEIYLSSDTLCLTPENREDLFFVIKVQFPESVTVNDLKEKYPQFFDLVIRDKNTYKGGSMNMLFKAGSTNIFKSFISEDNNDPDIKRRYYHDMRGIFQVVTGQVNHPRLKPNPDDNTLIYAEIVKNFVPSAYGLQNTEGPVFYFVTQDKLKLVDGKEIYLHFSSVLEGRAFQNFGTPNVFIPAREFGNLRDSFMFAASFTPSKNKYFPQKLITNTANNDDLKRVYFLDGGGLALEVNENYSVENVKIYKKDALTKDYFEDQKGDIDKFDREVYVLKDLNYSDGDEYLLKGWIEFKRNAIYG